MSGKKCKHCGSSEIEVDPARGDAVCTSCGTVLEDNIIVAEVEFQENAHGGASAIGQFVSADSKGGATGFGRAFNVGIGQESREVTLRKAREGLTNLCQQLRLNQQCIDIACNFYKMALSLHLTIGRPSSHTQAACVYMTCRSEKTPHLLIDVSDAASICCYQLGRTYFKLARALCIMIPPNDPCLYILRFASQLQFEDKQHEVSMTALRLVQRMKRDSIHSGRRPSGICGAALLIAARLHDFNRTPSDVVRIVKIHESTLRKRLLEFGETPSSALTVDEFMTVDLEEDQDPPSFRAARKRDKDRLQKLIEEEDGERELTELQKEIDLQLEKDCKKRTPKAVAVTRSTPGPSCASISGPTLITLDDLESTMETETATRFTLEIVLDKAVESALENDTDSQDITDAEFAEPAKPDKGTSVSGDVTLRMIGLERSEKSSKPEPAYSFPSLDDVATTEKVEHGLDCVILPPSEEAYKRSLWQRVHGTYLREQKIKEEMRAREAEENKGKKKVRGSYKKKVALNAATASEAVGKMLAERKISTKINYDILKSLDERGGKIPPTTPKPSAPAEIDSKAATPISSTTPVTAATPKSLINYPPLTIQESPLPRKKKKKPVPKTQAREKDPAPPTPAPAPSTPAPPTPSAEITDDFDEDVEEPVPDTTDQLSLGALLQNGNEDDYPYDYDEY